MQPRIDRTRFGSVTIDGKAYEHDVLIRLGGQLEKRKKKLSKAVYGTSHVISLAEARHVYQKGAELLLIGAVRDRVEELLRLEGYDDPYRLYAVWYDGTSTFSCSGGAWPPDLPGHVAALCLRGRYTADDGHQVDCSRDRFSSDGTTVEINEFKMLHEILHTIGLVGRGAPHHTQEGHTSDSHTDLMYAGPPPWEPSFLDVGYDDYYLTGRTDIPDLSRSVFLDPLPAPPTPPPGW